MSEMQQMNKEEKSGPFTRRAMAKKKEVFKRYIFALISDNPFLFDKKIPIIKGFICQIEYEENAGWSY